MSHIQQLLAAFYSGSGGGTTYATWDPNDYSAGTLSNGNLTLAGGGGSALNARSTLNIFSGKWYWEVHVDTIGSDIIGIESAKENLLNSGYTCPEFWGYMASGAKINAITDPYGGTAYGNSYTTGDTIGIAVDMDAKKVWFAKNNTWQNSGSPSAGTNPAFTLVTGIIKAAMGAYSTNGTYTANFGATALTYTPPSGFNAGLYFTSAMNPVWASGGNLASNRYGNAGVGSKTAALCIGGLGADYLINTDSYNGTTWSTGGNLTTKRMAEGAAGTTLAALAFGGMTTGGATTSSTEEYNGTSWASGGALTAGRYNFMGSGVQNAALAVSGYDTGYLTSTEKYNGTSWSSAGSVTTGSTYSQVTGSLNSTMMAGGTTPGDTATVSKYNGTSWSSGTDMPSARSQGGVSGDSSRAVMIWAGNGQSTTSINWNNTSWSSGASTVVNRYNTGSCGTTTGALAIAGIGGQSSSESYTG